MESWSFQESSSVFQTNRDVERSQSLRKNRQFRSKRFKDRVTSRSQKPTTKRNFTSKAFQEIPVIEKSIADVQARQVSLSFKKVSLEILQSLVGDVKVKRFIGNLSGDSEKNIMSTVFWPTVWDGIWRQYTLDVPRCNIHFKGTKWVDPFLLFMSLEDSLGPMWSRWCCVFLNQAAMADVFSLVWQDAQQVYGESTIVCEGRDVSMWPGYYNLDIYISCLGGDDQCDSITYSKNFRVMKRGVDGLKETIELNVETQYKVSFLPQFNASLTWKYQTQQNPTFGSVLIK